MRERPYAPERADDETDTDQTDTDQADADLGERGRTPELAQICVGRPKNWSAVQTRLLRAA